MADIFRFRKNFLKKKQLFYHFWVFYPQRELPIDINHANMHQNDIDEYPFIVHTSSKLTIATRKSPLALWQANYAAMQINTVLPNITIEILGFSTRGDEHLNTSLSKIGGKGLFTKELEHALLTGQADLAVHSMKDLPVDITDDLTITAVCGREDPRDVWISPQYPNWHMLPKGARIGTSSLRRQMQLLALRPDVEVVPLRGNIGTRLTKLDEGNFDGIILAAAGLIRMQLQNHIADYFSMDAMLPAIGQGILGLQIASANHELADKLKPLNCMTTWHCLTAERALSRTLGASCQTPLAGFASIVGQTLQLRAKLGSPDAQKILSIEKIAPVQDADALGQAVATEFLELGGAALIAQ